MVVYKKYKRNKQTNNQQSNNQQTNNQTTNNKNSQEITEEVKKQIDEKLALMFKTKETISKEENDVIQIQDELNIDILKDMVDEKLFLLF